MKNDDPKKARGSEERPGHDNARHDRQRDYSPFAKDKRARIKRVEKAVPGHRPEGATGERDDRRPAPQGERRSFNPNFNRDNTKRDDGSRGAPHRDGNRPHNGKGPGDRSAGGHGGYGKPPGGKKPWDKTGKKPGPGKGRGKKKEFDNGRRPDGSYPAFPAPRIAGQMRLNRFIAVSGACSRREADENISLGLVTVNGVVVTEMGTRVGPEDTVRFDGRPVLSEKKVYIVMNKPKGYVTTLDDPHAEKTVMDLLKNSCTERVYPVGRLDKNSLGVLLVTNDGDLTRKLIHPSYNKKKIYQVTLDKALTRADMEQIARGITLEDGEIYADTINYVGDSKRDIGIEIHSGRNRIVRRIFEHLGYRVMKLDRVYFAGLTKKNLKRGQWRFLAPREVEVLRSGMYE